MFDCSCLEVFSRPDLTLTAPVVHSYLVCSVVIYCPLHESCFVYLWLLREILWQPALNKLKCTLASNTSLYTYNTVVATVQLSAWWELNNTSNWLPHINLQNLYTLKLHPLKCFHVSGMLSSNSPLIVLILGMSGPLQSHWAPSLFGA